jgi:16S rRNA G527 N7-methylase RsmG
LIDCNNKRLLSFLKALIATKKLSYVRLIQSRIFVEKKETLFMIVCLSVAPKES